MTSFNLETGRGRLGATELADRLRSDILAKRCAPEERLESIADLSKRWNLAPVTVRRALAILERDGFITVRHGLGAFVSRRAEVDSHPLAGFDGDSAQDGPQWQVRILAVRLAAPRPDAAPALHCPEQEKLAVIERLRLLGGVPVVLQHSYAARSLEPLFRSLKPSQSLYDLIRRRTGHEICRSAETVTIASVGPEQADLLRLPAGARVWLSRRLSIARSGAPVLWDEAWLHPDYCRLNVERRGRESDVRLDFDLPADRPDAVELKRKL